MLKKIKEDIKKRMTHYNDSRQPTGDEVTIAWLISEIDRLKNIIKTLKGGININTIQAVAVNNNTPLSVRKVTVDKLTYNPSYVKQRQVTSEQCIIIAQKELFSAWGILAEECIVHLVKGESLCCTYITEDNKLSVIQMNGCNSTKTLPECYKKVIP